MFTLNALAQIICITMRTETSSIMFLLMIPQVTQDLEKE